MLSRRCFLAATVCAPLVRPAKQMKIIREEPIRFTALKGCSVICGKIYGYEKFGAIILEDRKIVKYDFS